MLWLHLVYFTANDIDLCQIIAYCRGEFPNSSLTAQAEVLVRAVPTVIEAVAHPVLVHTQKVLTLELVVRTPAAPWETGGWMW